jgi:uncharacterized membrane protein YedE/YeeE
MVIMRLAAQFAFGLIFGLGLIISGMINPAKVLNFLDIAGTWDPSLALVMAGAVITAFGGYRLAQRRDAPLIADSFHLPAVASIDRRLILGSAIFGLGWGLGGYCPGPAVTALAWLAPGTLIFIPAMLAGMWLARRLAIARPPTSVAEVS